MRTGEIRCGYGVSDPWIYQNFETGKPEGLMVDLAEALGKRLDLKIVWGEETGWSNIPQSLYNRRVDLSCTPLWTDPVRGKLVSFSEPVFYNTMHAFTRATEEKFTSYTSINQEDVKITAQDGGYGIGIASRLFSKAKVVSVAQQAQWQDIFLNVANNKADILFADSLSVKNYNKNNENKLKKIELGGPVVVYGNSFAVDVRDHAMLEMINTAVRYLLMTGEIEALTREFREKYPDVILLPKKPYNTVQ